MYSYEIKPHLRETLNKLFKKNRICYEQIFKKIEEIINSNKADHYKNLRSPLQHLKGVHIGHFVLVFSVNETLKVISFENYKHHDEIYKNPY